MKSSATSCGRAKARLDQMSQRMVMSSANMQFLLKLCMTHPHMSVLADAMFIA